VTLARIVAFLFLLFAVALVARRPFVILPLSGPNSLPDDAKTAFRLFIGSCVFVFSAITHSVVQLRTQPLRRATYQLLSR
jgi:hypothetical protein